MYILVSVEISINTGLLMINTNIPEVLSLKVS